MHCVGALIGHVPILGTETPRRFLAVLAALHLPRDRPLQALELLQTPLQVASVLLLMAGRGPGPLLYAQARGGGVAWGARRWARARTCMSGRTHGTETGGRRTARKRRGVSVPSIGTWPISAPTHCISLPAGWRKPSQWW